MNVGPAVQARLIAPFLPLLFFAGCSRPAPVESADPGAKVEVQAVQVRETAVRRTVELVGTLEGNRDVTVASEVAGRVVALHAELGDPVKPGQLLAEIDPREYALAVDRQQAALQQVLASLGLTGENDPMPAPADTSLVRKAAADLADARTVYDRARSLVAKGVSAQQVLDTAESRLKVAEANYTAALEGVRNLTAQADNLRVQLATARKKLADTRVYAPFEGAVRARQAEIGQYIKEQGALYAITAMNPLKLRAAVPEPWFPYVASGAGVQITVEAYRETFLGRVAHVARTMDPQTRTFAIEAEVDNARQRLRPGLFARAVLTTSREDQVLRVPAQAVVSYYGVQKVYVIENGQIREQVVRLGDRTGELIEITEGLNPGAWIAVSELTRIHQGSRVAIREES